MAFFHEQANAFDTQGLAFEQYQVHCGDKRMATDVLFLEALSKQHPDYHVTCFHGGNCDIFAFAAAGHAKLELVAGDAPHSMKVAYEPPKETMRGRGGPGTLHDTHSFGQFKLTWNNIHFLYYRLLGGDARMRQGIPVNFFLAPRSVGTLSNGHSSATDELLLAIGAWENQVHHEIHVFDCGHWSRSKDLWKAVRDASWDDVILESQMKENIIRDVQGFFDSQSLYKEFQVPWKRGIILHGVPGNGKTMSIKALIPALYSRPDPIPSLYVKSCDNIPGNPASIKAIFTLARTMAPCLLIFEDLDTLVTEKTRSYFLNEVDGLDSNEGILMVASVNNLDKLDPAVRDRPSRFDRKYYYKLPGEPERKEYVRYWQKKLAKNALLQFPESACDFITKMTDGFSFAYIKELFVVSLLEVARGGRGDKQAPDSSNLSGVYKPSVAMSDIEEGGAHTPVPAILLLQRALTALEIPDELRDNSLVRVMRQQATILLGEMDNNAVAAFMPTRRGSLSGASSDGWAVAP